MVQVLDSVAPLLHPWVDTNVGPLDDAAVLRPESGPALVFTVDFITPIVDQPETFGAIAAANALSDVYAMGGDPQVALAVCGFPADRLPRDVLRRIFVGGRDKAAEAGCAIVGGHTMQDTELKYGLCVIGSLPASDPLTKGRAQPGDLLVLTKPLGVGVASQAIKRGELAAKDLAAVVALMTTLNRGAKDAALAAGASAATDVTGFGLLGHLHHLLLAAGASARLDLAAVPVLDCAWPLARAGAVPGGSRKNLDYVSPHCRWGPSVDEATRLVLADAQTSGGLLIVVPPSRADALLLELERRATLARAVVGEILAGEDGAITVA